MSEIKCYENLEFNKVIDIIESTKTKVYKKINEEYWEMPFEVIEIVKDDSNKYLVGSKFCVNCNCVPSSYNKVN